MGGWQLEIGKMAIYMMFPVGMFYFFNHPQHFENWVTKVKKETFPPENPENRRLYEETVANINKRHELRMLNSLQGK